MPSEGEGVVARRGSDHSVLLLLGRELHEGVAASPLLERAGVLHEVFLKVHIGIAYLRDEVRLIAMCVADARADAVHCFGHVFEGDGT